MERKSLETLSALKTHKSRLSKENQEVSIQSFYDEKRFRQILWLLSWVNLRHVFKYFRPLPNRWKETLAKEIYKDPEKYFTPEVMDAIDA